MSQEKKEEKKEQKAMDKFPRRFAFIFAFFLLILYRPQLIFMPDYVRGIFHGSEDRWRDTLFKLRKSSLKTGDPRLIIAAMDEDTGREYGFPLPRRIQARLIDALGKYGVKTITFDVMFFEPMSKRDDRALIRATKRHGKVIHLYQSRTENTPMGPVVSVNVPIEGLGEAAEFLGYPNIDHVIDPDGHVRRSKLFDENYENPIKDNEIAASMDVVTAASFLGKPLSHFQELYMISEEDYDGNIVRESRTMQINFRRPRDWLQHEKRDEGKTNQLNLAKIHSPYRMVSVMDIISGELTEGQKKALKGSIVLVGSTSLGYFDHYPTPFLPTAPGVEYHANHVDNMLHEDFLDVVGSLFTMLVILFMIFLPLYLLRVSPAAANIVVAGVLGSWCVFTWVSFGRGLLVEFVAPCVALVISFLVITVHRVLAEGAEKRFIKNLFGQFVAPEVVNDLAKDPSKVRLGGERRDMTILFLDIAHFTTISEKMTPEALIVFLNRFLSALSLVIQNHKGVVDKYIGDCIMAFWNAPMELKDHRAQACLAAVECQQALDELNKTVDPTLPEVPAIRIGLNSGETIVGLTGSQTKLQYTVIGDEVNLASRLEGANKFFGSKTMASQSTYDGARDVVEARELGRVRVVGKAIPIKVFELLAKKGRLSDDWKKALPIYEKGIAHFNKKEFEEAKGAFEEVIKIFPKDGPSNLYLTVSTDYSVIPPPEDWDGVFNLTAK